MQNRYVADVGDFGKFGLLRIIAKTGLNLGINWYLVPDESHNEDGKHISYISSSNYDHCDELRSILKKIILQNDRTVQSLQDSRILLAKTVYYNDILNFSYVEDWVERSKIRRTWHNAALEKLKECDIVFLDPDNGLQTNSTSLTSKKGNKYIGIEELCDYFKLGKSLIFYNHRERKTEEQYLNKFSMLREEEVFKEAYICGLKFRRGTICDYIFMLQPEHTHLVKQYCEMLLSSAWNNHFSMLNI